MHAVCMRSRMAGEYSGIGESACSAHAVHTQCTAVSKCTCTCTSTCNMQHVRAFFLSALSFMVFSSARRLASCSLAPSKVSIAVLNEAKRVSGVITLLAIIFTPIRTPALNFPAKTRSTPIHHLACLEYRLSCLLC